MQPTCSRPGIGFWLFCYPTESTCLPWQLAVTAPLWDCQAWSHVFHVYKRLPQARDGKLATNGVELEAERGARRQACAALEGLQQKLAQQGDALGKQARFHADKLCAQARVPFHANFCRV